MRVTATTTPKPARTTMPVTSWPNQLGAIALGTGWRRGRAPLEAGARRRLRDDPHRQRVGRDERGGHARGRDARWRLGRKAGSTAHAQRRRVCRVRRRARGRPARAFRRWTRGPGASCFAISMPRRRRGRSCTAGTGTATSRLRNNCTPNPNELDAVLLGPSSDQAAGWALSAKQAQGVGATGDRAFVYNALAESARRHRWRTTRSKRPPRRYLVPRARNPRGLRFADGVGRSERVLGRLHLVALPAQLGPPALHRVELRLQPRGDDLFIVDPSPYGGPSSWQANAVTADSSVVTGDYAPSQTPWSVADLPWAQGTSDATVAARSAFANAFIFDSTPSDIPVRAAGMDDAARGRGRRDRSRRTPARRRGTCTSRSTRTRAEAGWRRAMASTSERPGRRRSRVHPVLLSGRETPAVTQPTTGNCTASCAATRAPNATTFASPSTSTR